MEQGKARFLTGYAAHGAALGVANATDRVANASFAWIPKVFGDLNAKKF
jgi:hypothetical protein